MAFILFSLFVATVAADFAYTVFSDKHCSPGNAALSEVAETNGVCVSHDGGSAIVDCGPSGMVFNVWKWSSSSTCSGVPDVSLVAPSGSCEAFTSSSLQINCKASKKLNSAGSLAQRLLAAKTTTARPTTTTSKPKTTTAKPKTTTAKPKTTTAKPKTAIKGVATAAPTSATPTLSCPATGSPFPATNAQGKGVVVFPEGGTNANGRNACGQINGPGTATPTPSHAPTKTNVKYYAPVASPSPSPSPSPTKKSGGSIIFP